MDPHRVSQFELSPVCTKMHLFPCSPSLLLLSNNPSAEQEKSARKRFVIFVLCASWEHPASKCSVVSTGYRESLKKTNSPGSLQGIDETHFSSLKSLIN